MSEERQKKSARAVGPRYPFIDLQKALERCEEFRKAAGDHAILSEDAKQAWGYGAKSSGGDQTVGALRYYGLLERAGTGRVKLTDSARRYLRDERPEVRAELCRQFAFQPKVMRELWGDWQANPPPDAAARSILKVDRHFPDKAAEEVLRIYRANLAFVGSSSSDTLPPESTTSDDHGEANGEEESPPSTVRIGDYVQWTSGGVDQFKVPKKVTWVAEDGNHVRVFGHMTGLPAEEITVVDPPAPPSVGASRQSTRHERSDAVRDINILLLGSGRLQITAEVNKEGLATLRQMLDKYEEILGLMATPMNQFEPPAEGSEEKDQE
jgi:hypothetical protein